MALKKITEGLSGQEAANIIYENDNYLNDITLNTFKVNQPLSWETGFYIHESGEKRTWNGYAKLSAKQDLTGIEYIRAYNVSAVNELSCVVAFFKADNSFIADGSVQAKWLEVIKDTGWVKVPDGAAYVIIGYHTNADPNYVPATLYFQSLDKKIESIAMKALDTQIEVKQITMVGDSIANQIGGQLKKIFPLEGRLFEDKAVGGESCLDTLARVGAIPYVVKPFTIPADTSEVEVKISSKKGYKQIIDPVTGLVTYEGGDLSIWGYDKMNCSIEGIEGILTMTRHTDGYLAKATFKRKTAGSALTLNRPTIVKSTHVNRNSVFICMMGTNGGWNLNNTIWGVQGFDKVYEILQGGTINVKADSSALVNGSPVSVATAYDVKGDNGQRMRLYLDANSKLYQLRNDYATFEDADNLVNYYKKIADWIRPTGNDFLFLSFYETSLTLNMGAVKNKEWMEYFERRMEEEFGMNYFNFRKYLMTDGWKDAGIASLTAEDITYIKNDRIPRSLLKDSIHLTDNFAAKAVANKVLERLHEIGVFKTIPGIL